MTSKEFWSGYQPGFRFARSPVGTKSFFDEVTAQRYAVEPHIPDVVDFERWSGCNVLEAGCGIGTDGARFSAAGARYTGLDFSPSALALARRRFELEGLQGHFLEASVTRLPFPDATFDLVFSHGVIHHIENTKEAVQEFDRVLKPGGTALVMVYHRRSLNYYVSLMLLRRLLVGVLVLPGSTRVVSKITGEPEEVLKGHKSLLLTHGLRYLVDRDLFLSRNTDGPGNPLSKAYSRAEARRIFADHFGFVTTAARYLNLRSYPGSGKLAITGIARVLERRWGWHLYVEARKGELASSRAAGQQPRPAGHHDAGWSTANR